MLKMIREMIRRNCEEQRDVILERYTRPADYYKTPWSEIIEESKKNMQR